MTLTRDHLVGRRYVLEDKLGEGGMGAVFRASDRLTGRHVALKRVAIDSTKKETHTLRLALAQEFRILASLRHPNIISVLDYGFDETPESIPQPYFTMDYLEGSQTLLEAAHGKSLSEQVRLLIDMLQALIYLHQRGILHRDLKPANVLVDQQGQVKVVDFGLSVGREQENAEEGAAGTLAYIAPEVLRNHPASEASDLYAVGVLAYELITGRHPFRIDNSAHLVYDVLLNDPDLSALDQIDKSLQTRPSLTNLSAVQTDVHVDLTNLDTLIKIKPPTVPHIDPDAVETIAGVDPDETVTGVNLPSNLESDTDATRTDLPMPLNLPATPSPSAPHPHLRPDEKPSLTKTIRKLMAKDPYDRYSDAYTVMYDLSAAVNQPIAEESIAIRESFLQSARFVGRERELQSLIDALRSAVRSNGSTWLIAGESGVGKSRLVDELRIHALVEGALVLRGQEIAEVGAPYHLWREPLRQLALTSSLSDDDGAILKSSIDDIEALVGRKLPPAPRLNAQARHERLVETIVNLFRQQTHPMVLLLEDLHWAEESLDPLQKLSAEAQNLPLLILATYRDDERPNLPADLPAASVLKLARLSDQGLAELSVSILGEVGSQPQLIRLLSKETEGNTFFVIETLRELAQEAGNLRQIGQMNLPMQVFAGGVRQVLQRRLARVPEADRPLLTIAAVAGRQIDLPLLRALSGQNDLEEWLHHCADAAVLAADTSTAESNRWMFAHDKLREALVADLADADKRELHRQIAAALEIVNPGQVASLGYHWYMGEAWEQAVDPLAAAGDAAALLFANADARLHYRRALESLSHLPDTEDNRRRRIEITLDYDEAAFLHEPVEQSLTRLEEADALAASMTDQSVDQQRLVARINLLRGRSYSLQPHGQMTAMGYFQKVYATAEAIGDTELIIVPSTVMGSIMTIQGYFNRAIPLLNRTITRPDMLYWSIGMTYSGISLVQHGEYRAALKHIGEFQAAVKAMGNPEFIAQATTTQHLVYLIGGDYAQALATGEEALDLCQKTNDLILLLTLYQSMAWVYNRIGEREKASASSAQAQTIIQQLGGNVPLGDWFAVADIERLLLDQQYGDVIQQAQELITRTRAMESLFPPGFAYRLLAQAQSAQNLIKEAEESMTESLRLFEMGEANTEAARTRVVYGDFLRQQGDLDGAREQWQTAADAFERGGFQHDLKDVRARIAQP